MPDSLKVTRQKRSGFFADCSRLEFERRLGRLREEMERSGVDWYFLGSFMDYSLNIGGRAPRTNDSSIRLLVFIRVHSWFVVFLGG